MARLNVVLFAGVVALFAAILSPVEAGPKKAIEACMQQTGATQADFESFMKTGQASHQLKCMLSCGLQKMKLMTADGALDEDFIKSALPSAMAGLVDTCIGKSKSADDVCQRAAIYLHCFMSAEPKFFIEFITSD